MATVALGDARIGFDDFGAGEPVLLLHGFPATRRLWSQVAPRLAEAGYRVLAPDLVGYGESEPAPGVGVGMVNQARWMLELLDRLGIQQAAVVAHKGDSRHSTDASLTNSNLLLPDSLKETVPGTEI